MSFWSEKWAYEQEPQSSGAKFVLVCLAHHADEHGYCYPSQKRIAAMTGLKERAVRGHLATLEQDGFIRRRERRRDDGKRTSDGIWLLIPEDQLKLPAEIAASQKGTGKKRPGLPAKNDQGYRQKLPDKNNQKEPSQEPPVVDDTTTTCLKILQKVEGFPRDEAQNALKLSEYRDEFLSADPLEVCRDFAAYISEKPFRKGDKPRLRLRNFFKQANRRPNYGNGRRAPEPSAPLDPQRRKAGYEWLFEEDEAKDEPKRDLDAELKKMREAS